CGPRPAGPGCRLERSRRAGSAWRLLTSGRALEPGVASARDVFAGALLGQTEVLADQREQVAWRGARQDALDDVFVLGVAGWLALEDPGAGLAAEDVTLPRVLAHRRGVRARSAAAQHQLAQTAEGDGRRALGVP